MPAANPQSPNALGTSTSSMAPPIAPPAGARPAMAAPAGSPLPGAGGNAPGVVTQPPNMPVLPTSVMTAKAGAFKRAEELSALYRAMTLLKEAADEEKKDEPKEPKKKTTGSEAAKGAIGGAAAGGALGTVAGGRSLARAHVPGIVEESLHTLKTDPKIKLNIPYDPNSPTAALDMLKGVENAAIQHSEKQYPIGSLKRMLAQFGRQPGAAMGHMARQVAVPAVAGAAGGAGIMALLHKLQERKARQPQPQ